MMLRMPDIDLLAAFVADMQSRRLSPETIRTYSWILRDFSKLMQSRSVSLEAVKRPDLKAYLDSLNTKGISHKTASLRFGALSSFYDYLVFEERIESNPARPVQKRYLQAYKTPQGHTHQLITIEQAAAMVREMTEVQHKALFVLMLKTGVRRRELIAMDADDINWQNQSITLKPTAKRSNRVVFFDEEAEGLLCRWLRVREHRNSKNDPALFISNIGRMKQSSVDRVLVVPATRLGLHDTTSPDMERHFSAHCTRHFFTTYLDRAGMKREHIQVLRGDVGREAIDIYLHNDMEKIRKEYLACIPRLGI